MKMKILCVIVSFLLLPGCQERIGVDCSNNIPKVEKIVSKLPKKNCFWLFVMAGQSNMSGEACVEPQDTIPNERILVLNEIGNWAIAKEPIHHIGKEGLGCGLAFAKELINHLEDSIVIGIVPTAIPGSSIEDWLLNRKKYNVNIYDNFRKKINCSVRQGVLKGILWLQGESDTNKEASLYYKVYLKLFFEKISEEFIIANNTPIFLGEIGPFGDILNRQPYWNEINDKIKEFVEETPNAYLIQTSDLHHNGDNLHFDSYSQRTLGKRYAYKFLNTFLYSN